jgi:hypothetical protein
MRIKRNDIDKDFFDSIFKERFLEFKDDYSETKLLIKTYGVYSPNLIKINHKIDAFITNIKSNDHEKIEEIKENIEFIKDYFNLKRYVIDFYTERDYYNTIYLDRTRRNFFFYGNYMLVRFFR